MPSPVKDSQRSLEGDCQRGIELVVSHIPGDQNELADLLSRAHLSNSNQCKVVARALQCNAVLLPVTTDLFKC